MSNLATQIQSIRQTLAGGYKKPETSLQSSYQDALSENQTAIDYLKNTRGFSDDTIKNFKLGYCSERDAISIPVYKSGELINIRYRHLDPDARQKYTQERGCEVWLYNDDGIDKAREKGSVLIVEGEFDLMSAWQAGVKNIVSPASGKDSYGVWIELLDTIPKVYIAYDNDTPGKKAALGLAERVGIDKSFEVLYPTGYKDANEYFLKHTISEFRSLVSKAIPYYKHKFSGIGDIIESLKGIVEPKLQLDTVPYVRWSADTLAILSADSNGGKTTYALNIADELANRGIPTLILPFERGIQVVGSRYLQVRYEKQEEDLETMTDEELEVLRLDAAELPLYFSKPSQEEFFDTVLRGKRLFGIKFMIIDHLDYFIRGNDTVQQQKDFIHKLKDFCIDNEMICIVVHHIGKDKDGRRRKSKLSKEDLKGAGDLYQVPEVVIMLYPNDDGRTTIDICKNKGKEGVRFCEVNTSTGRFSKPSDILRTDLNVIEEESEKAWNRDDF